MMKRSANDDMESKKTSLSRVNSFTFKSENEKVKLPRQKCHLGDQVKKHSALNNLNLFVQNNR
jgi:hypothetical protein